MLNDITRFGLVGFWFAAVSVVIASVMAMGMTIGVSTTALLLTVSLAPPGIILMWWRGAPAETVGEILYSANDGIEAAHDHGSPPGGRLARPLLPERCQLLGSRRRRCD